MAYRRHAPLLLLLATAWPAPARAVASLQAIGTVGAGWTDNILNMPVSPLPNQPSREADFFFLIQPGALFTQAAPRIAQRLQAVLGIDLFAHHSEANSYSGTIDWSGLVALTPRLELLLSSESQIGRLNSFNLQASSDPNAKGVNNSLHFFNQIFGETLSYTPRAQWRLLEMMSFRAFIPIERGTIPDSYNTVGELTGEHLFRRDSLALILRLDYTIYEALVGDASGDTPTSPRQRQLLSSARGRWRHDWSPSWSTELSAGLLEAMNLDDSAHRLWQPMIFAAIRWYRDIANAEVYYSRDITPNLLAGFNIVSDAAGVQIGVPFPERSKMIFSASASYQYARQLDPANVIQATAHAFVADVSIGWQPIPELGFFARYSLLDQYGPPPVVQGDTVTFSQLPSITRNLVFVGINVRYPGKSAIRVPTRFGSRVDRADQPSLPSLHSPR